MNWLDVIILCLAAVGLIKGLKDGIIRQAVSLVAFVAGVYLCREVAVSLGAFLAKSNWFPSNYAYPASYFLAFVLIVSIVLAAGYIVHRLVSVTPLSLFNHLIGGVVGLFIMLLFLSLIFNGLELLDKNSVLLSHEMKVESRFYYAVKSIIPSLLPGFP